MENKYIYFFHRCKKVLKDNTRQKIFRTTWITRVGLRHKVFQFDFRGFYVLPHLRKFHPRNFTKLRHGTIMNMDFRVFPRNLHASGYGNKCGYASPTPTPKWPQTSHDWPKEPLPGALSSYGCAFPADPGYVQAVSHTTCLPGAI